MVGRRRNKDERESDQAKVAELKFKGLTEREIAKKTGISKSQVNYDIQAMRRQWRASRESNMEDIIAEQLAEIARLKKEYWVNYLLTAEKEIFEADPVDPAKKIMKKIRVPGRKRFLDGVQWCIQEKARIEGLYAATNLNINPTGELADLMKKDETEIDGKINDLLGRFITTEGNMVDGVDLSKLIEAVKSGTTITEPKGSNGSAKTPPDQRG